MGTQKGRQWPLLGCWVWLLFEQAMAAAIPTGTERQTGTAAPPWATSSDYFDPTMPMTAEMTIGSTTFTELEDPFAGNPGSTSDVNLVQKGTQNPSLATTTTSTTDTNHKVEVTFPGEHIKQATQTLVKEKEVLEKGNSSNPLLEKGMAQQTQSSEAVTAVAGKANAGSDLNPGGALLGETTGAIAGPSTAGVLGAQLIPTGGRGDSEGAGPATASSTDVEGVGPGVGVALGGQLVVPSTSPREKLPGAADSSSGATGAPSNGAAVSPGSSSGGVTPPASSGSNAAATGPLSNGAAVSPGSSGGGVTPPASSGSNAGATGPPSNGAAVSPGSSGGGVTPPASSGSNAGATGVPSNGAAVSPGSSSGGVTPPASSGSNAGATGAPSNGAAVSPGSSSGGATPPASSGSNAGATGAPSNGAAVSPGSSSGGATPPASSGSNAGATGAPSNGAAVSPGSSSGGVTPPASSGSNAGATGAPSNGAAVSPGSSSGGVTPPASSGSNAGATGTPSNGAAVSPGSSSGGVTPPASSGSNAGATGAPSNGAAVSPGSSGGGVTPPASSGSNSAATGAPSNGAAVSPSSSSGGVSPSASSGSNAAATGAPSNGSPVSPGSSSGGASLPGSSGSNAGATGAPSSGSPVPLVPSSGDVGFSSSANSNSAATPEGDLAFKGARVHVFSLPDSSQPALVSVGLGDSSVASPGNTGRTESSVSVAKGQGVSSKNGSTGVLDPSSPLSKELAKILTGPLGGPPASSGTGGTGTAGGQLPSGPSSLGHKVSVNLGASKAGTFPSAKGGLSSSPSGRLVPSGKGPSPAASAGRGDSSSPVSGAGKGPVGALPAGHNHSSLSGPHGGSARDLKLPAGRSGPEVKAKLPSPSSVGQGAGTAKHVVSGKPEPPALAPSSNVPSGSRATKPGPSASASSSLSHPAAENKPKPVAGVSKGGPADGKASLPGKSGAQLTGSGDALHHTKPSPISKKADKRPDLPQQESRNGKPATARQRKARPGRRAAPSVPEPSAAPLFPYGPSANDKEYVERKVDFNSPLLRPEIGAPLGKKLFDSLYFTDNGQIIFSASGDNTGQYPNPPSKGFNGHEKVPMIAVFWHNADFSRGDGTIFYQEYVTRGAAKHPLIRDVEAKIRQHMRSSYSARWTLKVTWVKAQAYPAQQQDGRTNTYQAILTTDGYRTYALFLYQDGGMQWDYTKLPRSDVLIGYTSGDGHFRNDDLMSKAAAEKYRPDQLRGYNTGVRGLWIYKLDSRFQVNYRLRCLDWISHEGRPSAWNRSLPSCPCSLQQGRSDGRYIQGRKGVLGSRLTLLYSSTPNKYGAGVRCVYNSNNQLVEGHQEKVWRGSRRSFGSDEELKFYDWCCDQAGSQQLCDMYRQKRPKIGCNGYRPPVRALSSSSEENSDSRERE